MAIRTLLIFAVLLASSSSAPMKASNKSSAAESRNLSPRTLNTMVSGVTTGMEVPGDLVAGIGAGTGAIQLVINVHTDSHGNIEVYTN